MNIRNFFKVEEASDFFRLLIFLIVSPIIGIVMCIGLVTTSIGMVCMYINDKIMEKIKL